MSFKSKHRGLLWFCALAGLMDASSGSLLMLAPEFTLKLMWVPAVAVEAQVFVRFIGAFVFSVGCLYLGALSSVLMTGQLTFLRVLLLATAWVRTVICVSTSLMMYTGALPLEWISVPLSDGSLALFQAWVVFSGWLSDED